MKNTVSFIFLVIIVLIPNLLFAQSGDNAGVQKLSDILEKVHVDMLPLCEKLVSVARGLAGFGAIFYIAVRAGRNLAAAEPIDFFPLLRPFVLAALIGMYPLVIGTIEGLLKPLVKATNDLVADQDNAVKELLKIEYQLRSTGKVQIPVGTSESYDWYKYAHPEEAGKESSFGILSLMWGKIEGTVTYYLKLVITKILQILFYASALCLNAMRTFHLVILALLGPLVFALSAFDGFQHTLSVWLARYINIYMWLPIANIFSAMISKIQSNMIKSDIDAILAGGQGDTYDITNFSYLAFLIIGIMGYFSIPSIANYVVHASGGNVLMSKATKMASGVMSTVASGGKSGGSSAPSSGGGNSGSAGSYSADTPASDKLLSPVSDAANSEGYRNDAGHQQKRISG